MKRFKYPQVTQDPELKGFFGRSTYFLPNADKYGYGRYAKNLIVSGVLLLVSLLLILSGSYGWFGMSVGLKPILIGAGIGIVAITISMPAVMGKSYASYYAQKYKEARPKQDEQ